MEYNFIAEMKVNGQLITIDPAKLHESWVKRCLDYGIRQLINDTYSGEKGQTKYDLCRAMAADMQNGEPMPEKERKASVAKADPVRKLARDLATTALVEIFSRMHKTKEQKVWAEHEKTAKFFRQTEKGALRFDLAQVDAWMETYTARNFMAEAKETLDKASDVADDVDWAEFGL
jgi:hypothetical protein